MTFNSRGLQFCQSSLAGLLSNSGRGGAQGLYRSVRGWHVLGKVIVVRDHSLHKQAPSSLTFRFQAFSISMTQKASCRLCSQFKSSASPGPNAVKSSSDPRQVLCVPYRSVASGCAACPCSTSNASLPASADFHTNHGLWPAPSAASPAPELQRGGTARFFCLAAAVRVRRNCKCLSLLLTCTGASRSIRALLHHFKSGLFSMVIIHLFHQPTSQLGNRLLSKLLAGSKCWRKSQLISLYSACLLSVHQPSVMAP